MVIPLSPRRVTFVLSVGIALIAAVDVVRIERAT